MHKIEINGLQCDLVSLNNNDPEGFKYLEVDGILVYTRIDRPVITTQPVNSPDVVQGQNYSFSVIAQSGDGTLSYQWYYGESGDESNPQVGFTGATMTRSTDDIGTHKYWVKVSNERGSVNSVTVQVNVAAAGIFFDLTVGTTIDPDLGSNVYGFSGYGSPTFGALNGQSSSQSFTLDGKTLYVCDMFGGQHTILGTTLYVGLITFWTGITPPSPAGNVTGHTQFQAIFPDKTFHFYWNEDTQIGTPDWSLTPNPEVGGESKPWVDYLTSKNGQTLRFELKFL